MFKVSGRIRFELERSRSLIVHRKPTRAECFIEPCILSMNIVRGKRKDRKIQYVLYCAVNLLYFNYFTMHNRDRAENIPE